MIRNTIATINERIAGQLATDAVQVLGIAKPFQDQQEKAIGLLLDAGKRFSLDGKKVWQSLHLTDGNSVTDKQTFGSFTDTIRDVRFILVGVTRTEAGMDVAYRALDGMGYVVIDNYEIDTLPVLTRYLRIKTGQEKNYDPALRAFAIRYHIEGVCDEDFAELPNDADLAVLPVAELNTNLPKANLPVSVASFDKLLELQTLLSAKAVVEVLVVADETDEDLPGRPNKYLVTKTTYEKYATLGH